MKNTRIKLRIREELVQTERGDFVADKEMKSFFAKCSAPSVEEQWIDECTCRCTAIDEGTMPLIDVSEVMQKYRQSPQ